VPEITSPFDEPPRAEAPGEKRQRYAGLVTEISNALGVTLSEIERERIGAFLVNVLAQLTPAQQKALGELAGKLVAWAVQKYMGK
jgi:hypothetical protein